MPCLGILLQPLQCMKENNKNVHFSAIPLSQPGKPGCLFRNRSCNQ